jgi:glutamate/tyrosine decarboxylase-like PLP-dependent enzyme
MSQSPTDRQLLHQANSLFADYLEHCADPEQPVVPYLSPEAVAQKFDLQIPEQGVGYDQFFSDIETYLNYAVRTRHPQFFNQLWAGYATPSLIGQMVSDVTNTSMYTYEMAPVATRIELAVIRKMCDIAGYPEGDGIFTPGGSTANMNALLVARNTLFPDYLTKGQAALPKPLRLYVSDQAHYSFDRAANTLGIGTDNVVAVATDADGKMLPDALARAIAADIEAGYQPFFVCATQGTTVLGAFDPIEPIHAIAKQYNLWLHIDAAWGGVVQLHPEYRHLMADAHLGDSMTWNPHKTMGMLLPCSVLLTKQSGQLLSSCSGGNTEYIFHDYDNKAWDLGPKSLQCGRRVEALKLWLTWRLYGDAGYRDRVAEVFRLAEYAEAKVQAHPRLQQLAPRAFWNLCFQYVPEGGKADVANNQLNFAIRERMIREGKSMVNYSYLKDGRFIFRLILANPEIGTAAVDRFFDDLLEVGESFTRELAPLAEQVA